MAFMIASSQSVERSYRFRAAVGLVALAVAAWSLFSLSSIIAEHRYTRRGVLTTELPPVPARAPQTYGVNVALEHTTSSAEMERILRLARELGFRWVRQRVPWTEIELSPGVFDWQRWDSLLLEIEKQDLEVLLVVDQPPAWARAPGDALNPWAPPQFVSTYALFVRALAERYRGRVAGYQVWDQPNISPHWGSREIDPPAYVRLLRVAAQEIRRADPQALVLSAALAPNTELGGRNMSDVLFLRGMYGAGAKGTFDVLGAKLYGFWSGPEDRRVDPTVLNFSRAILLREEMVQAGDGNTPIWAVEFGWNSLPADWRGQPSPWGSDGGEVQGDRIVRAVERARSEWAWLGLVCWAHLRPAAIQEDPVWGYALLSPCFLPTPLYDAVEQAVTIPSVREIPDDAAHRHALALRLVLGGLALAVAGLALVGTPWRAWLNAGLQRYQGLPERMHWLMMGAIWVVYYVVPADSLAIAALALAAVVVALRPEIGLTSLVFSIPFFLHTRSVFGMAFSVTELLTVMVALAYVLRWLGALWAAIRERSVSLRTQVRAVFAGMTSLDWAVVAFLLLGALSLRVSLYRGVSLREFRVVVLEPVVLYGLLRQAKLSAEGRRRLVDALLVSGLVVAAYGLFQLFVTGDVIAAEGVRRVHSVYPSPNNLSLFLARIVPFGVSVALVGRGRRRWLYGVALVPLLVCLLLTYSRGALLLGVPAALLAIALLRGRRSTMVVLVLVLLAMLLAVTALGPQRMTSLLNLEEGTTFRRVRLWESAVAMIRDYPISGIGLDNFLYRYPAYMRPDAWQEPGLSHPHNIILDFWTRLGVGGPLILMWLLFSFLRLSFGQYHRLADGNARAIILGALAAMVGSLAHGLIDNSYFLVDLAFVFFFLIGLIRTANEAQPQGDGIGGTAT